MTCRLPVTHATLLFCPSNMTMSFLSLSSPPSLSSLFSSSSSSSDYLFPPLPLRSASSRTFASCSCSCSSSSSSSLSKVRAQERLLMENHSPNNLAPPVFSSRTFLNARSEQELLSGLRKEVEGGFLPSNVASAMEQVYHSYKNAVSRSGDPRAEEILLSNMTIFLDRIFMDVVDPFVFNSHHKAKREPFDYYLFGQNYIRPLIDFRNSYIGNVSLFCEMEEKLKQGHNIILMSNHQTEADPAIIALLIEKSFPYIAENLTYVAGDRVITDPLCKPFSMGRNLICVYSKKHMNDVPELVEMKRKANTRSLKEMAMLLRSGSQIIWIAPSGGRDRPDPLTAEWTPVGCGIEDSIMAQFDASSVDNMRRLVENSGVAGHMYPLALLCYDIMPPPPQVEKEIGEKRVISFHGVGLSVAPEISFSETAASCQSPEMAKEAYTQAMYNSVSEQYNVLKSAVYSQQGLEASTPNVSLSQP